MLSSMRPIALVRRKTGSRSKIRRHPPPLALLMEHSNRLFLGGPRGRYFVPSKIQNGNDNKGYNYECHHLTMKAGVHTSSFADLEMVGCDGHHIYTDPAAATGTTSCRAGP
jgi:hypothetical protein